jgi:hypothetical protein
MSESINALRRANPRNNPELAQSVKATAATVESLVQQPAPRTPVSRRRRLGPAAMGILAAGVAAVVVLALVSSPDDVSASAAVKKAASATAASAERSGTAQLRITQGGALWASTTVRWHGDDVAISAPGRSGGELLVVDGLMYGIDPADGSWAELGPVSSIDPDSGTTPTEYLTVVREDIGGTTLRRLIDGMTDLSAKESDAGTVYSGKVAAGLIARESGFKEGQAIRVFPFGYVAHGDAANPNALLDTTVAVNAHGVVSDITVTWGHGSSTWQYTIGYSKLGDTAAVVAPANARPLRRGMPPHVTATP